MLLKSIKICYIEMSILLRLLKLIKILLKKFDLQAFILMVFAVLAIPVHAETQGCDIEVSNVEDLRAQISDDKTICLADGDYRFEGDHPTLRIEGRDHLTIKGVSNDPKKVRLISTNEEQPVVLVTDSTAILLSDLTLTRELNGSVPIANGFSLQASDTKELWLTNTILTVSSYALDLTNVDQLEVKDTVVGKATLGVVALRDTTSAIFRNVTMNDLGSYRLFYFRGDEASSLELYQSMLEETVKCDDFAFFEGDGDYRLIFENSTIYLPMDCRLRFGSGNLQLEDSTLRNILINFEK